MNRVTIGSVGLCLLLVSLVLGCEESDGLAADVGPDVREDRIHPDNGVLWPEPDSAPDAQRADVPVLDAEVDTRPEPEPEPEPEPDCIPRELSQPEACYDGQGACVAGDGRFYGTCTAVNVCRLDGCADQLEPAVPDDMCLRADWDEHYCTTCADGSEPNDGGGCGIPL